MIFHIGGDIGSGNGGGNCDGIGGDAGVGSLVLVSVVCQCYAIK